MTAVWGSGTRVSLSPPSPRGKRLRVILSPYVQEYVVSSSTEREMVRAALVRVGLSLPEPEAPAAGLLSDEQREELALRISVGTPLSELIIEDRRGS